MFFHRDDAVAHRLRLSGDRPVAKKSPARTWSFVCEGAALMSAAPPDMKNGGSARGLEECSGGRPCRIDATVHR